MKGICRRDLWKGYPNLQKGFVGNFDSFLLLVPVDASKGFENVDTG